MQAGKVRKTLTLGVSPGPDMERMVGSGWVGTQQLCVHKDTVGEKSRAQGPSIPDSLGT